MIRILTGFPFSWWKRASVVVPVAPGAAGGSSVVHGHRKPLVFESYTRFVPLIWPIQAEARFELPALEIQATATLRHVAQAEFSIGGIAISATAGYRPPVVNSKAGFGLPSIQIKAHATADLTPFLKREDEELLELLAA